MGTLEAVTPKQETVHCALPSATPPKNCSFVLETGSQIEVIFMRHEQQSFYTVCEAVQSFWRLCSRGNVLVNCVYLGV